MKSNQSLISLSNLGVFPEVYSSKRGFRIHTMPEGSTYWRDWPESQLASYQQDQGSSNHCAKYAAASALNLLYGTSLLGSSLVDWMDSRFLKGTGIYSILGNHNGSLVFQTANLIRRLAGQVGLMPDVRCGFGTHTDIRKQLKYDWSLTIVTVTYFQGSEPIIARGTNTISSLGPSPILGGHIMILGAYSPEHRNTSGESTPWGFISSWSNKEHIYWMTERDFIRTWGKLSFFNMITVKRT